MVLGDERKAHAKPSELRDGVAEHGIERATPSPAARHFRS